MKIGINLMPRELSFYNRLKIYFSIAPFIFGEVALIFGISALIHVEGSSENLVIGIILLIVGFYFTYRKVKTIIRGIKIIRYGHSGTANLSYILNSSFVHNSRVVKNYFFNYKVDDKIYTYDFSSAYRRHLETGDKMEIYYLPSNPEYAFIPELYNVKIK
jgi:hypothetical protein